MPRIDILPYEIPFRRPLVTAAGTFHRRRGAIVRVIAHDGCAGLGEAAPHPAEPAAAFDRLLAALRTVRPDELTEDRLRELPAPVRPAFETALLDLEARRRSVPLASLLGEPCRETVRLNATLSEREPERIAAEARAAVSRGFRCLKLKGAGNSGDDARLHAVRDAVGADAALRIDVNGHAGVDPSIRALCRWAAFQPEYVEQPVRGLSDLAAVRRAVPVRLAADESVTGESAVGEIARLGAADVVVLKPAWLGLRASVAAARRAVQEGLDVVVTSALESSVGIAAALHVAAVVPDRLLACGLATAELLEHDVVADPPRVNEGRMELPAAPGLGVTLA